MWHCSCWISIVNMKRKPYCVGGMSARREQKCNDSGNVWGTIGASAFPTCGRWQSWLPGMGIASKPSATWAKPPRWPLTSGCRENSGRSRRCWEGRIKQLASLHKHKQPLVRQQRLSGGWPRASGMRRCERSFWLGRRFSRCCSKPNARPLRSRKTTDRRVCSASERTKLHHSDVSLRHAHADSGLPY